MRLLQNENTEEKKLRHLFFSFAFSSSFSPHIQVIHTQTSKKEQHRYNTRGTCIRLGKKIKRQTENGTTTTTTIRSAKIDLYFKPKNNKIQHVYVTQRKEREKKKKPKKKSYNNLHTAQEANIHAEDDDDDNNQKEEEVCNQRETKQE